VFTNNTDNTSTLTEKYKELAVFKQQADIENVQSQIEKDVEMDG
jgi:hypothetical protein